MTVTPCGFSSGFRNDRAKLCTGPMIRADPQMTGIYKRAKMIDEPLVLNTVSRHAKTQIRINPLGSSP